MRPIALVLALAASLNAPAAFAAAPDRSALDRARRAYNAGRYDAAIGAARHALEVPDQVDAARLVLARALLERFRTSSLPGDLVEARDTLRAISLPALAADRALRADGRLRPVAVPHRPLRRGRRAVRYRARVLRPAPAGSRDRLLDWWASALDRQVQESGADATELYGRVLERMELEARRDPSCAAAAYWIAAAARGLGRLDRAWQAAMAAWVRTGLTPDRAAALRADLDRLVLTAIIPDRAREHGPGQERPARGRRHDDHRLGALQGRLGALTARTVVAATMSAPPASAHGPGRSPCASHAHTGFSTGSASSSSDASSAVTWRTPFDRHRYASPIWNTPSQISATQSNVTAPVIGNPSGRHIAAATMFPDTTVFSVARGSARATARSPITVSA